MVKIQRFMVFFITLISLFIFITPTYASGRSASSLGSSAATRFRQSYASSSGIEKNVIKPTMSGAQMTTLNGKVSFSGQIECPNPKPFLQIFFQPKSTNDFYALISQAINSTHLNYQVKTPLISGVCSNGFISCNAGTWDNCKYYKWAFNSENEVSWKQVGDDTQLGMCFCVNSSCHGSVFQQFSGISSTFAQNLATEIATLNNFAISKVSSNFPTLTYYGQSADKCSTANVTGVGGTPSVSQLKNYYGNSPAISSEKQTVASKQIQDENSPYYLVVNSEYMKNNPTTEKSCETKRRVYLTDLHWLTDGGVNTDITCQALKKVGNNLYKCFLPVNGGGYGGCGVSFKYTTKGRFYVHLYVPDDYAFLIKVGGKTIYNVATHSDGETPGSYTATIDTTKYYSTPVEVYAAVGNTGGCNGVGKGSFAIYLKRYEKINIAKTDSCNAIDKNKCTLKDEQICDYNGQNCVYTVKDFHKMGVSLTKNCYVLEDKEAGLEWQVCADGSSIEYMTNAGVGAGTGILETGKNIWWVIKKTYECQTKGVTLPSLSREENIEQSGSYSNGKITYPDSTSKYAGLGGYSGSYKASYTPNTYQDCQYSCVVTSPAKRTNAISSGSKNIDATSPSGNSVKKEFLVCKKSANGQWYCPATGDETIVQPCVCLNMGARSIAVFSSAAAAAKDLTCSKE